MVILETMSPFWNHCKKRLKTLGNLFENIKIKMEMSSFRVTWLEIHKNNWMARPLVHKSSVWWISVENWIGKKRKDVGAPFLLRMQLGVQIIDCLLTYVVHTPSGMMCVENVKFVRNLFDVVDGGDCALSIPWLFVHARRSKSSTNFCAI